MTDDVYLVNLIATLRGFAQAYPEDMFPPVESRIREVLKVVHPGVQDRIAADMGRHFAKFANEAADAISALTVERDEQLASRDNFIVAKGLWQEFVTQLPNAKGAG